MAENMVGTARVPQFDDTPGNIVIFSANYLGIVPGEIRNMQCERAFLLVSSTLTRTTKSIGCLEMILGKHIVGKKVGESL